MDRLETLRYTAIALRIILYYSTEINEVPPLDMFNEHVYAFSKEGPSDSIPSTNEIYEFLARIFVSEDVQADCALLLLYLVERVVVCSDVAFHPHTWRRVLFTATILASKVSSTV